MGFDFPAMVNIEDKLEQMAEGTHKDYEELQSDYEEKLEEVEERVPDSMDDDQKANLALGQVRADISEQRAIPRNAEETRIVSLGRRGYINMGDDDEEVLITYGVVDPADEDKPRRPGVVLSEESSGADLHGIYDAFEPFNTLTADFDVEEGQQVSNVYILHATEDTNPEVLDTEMTIEDKRDWVNENFFEDPVELAEVGSHISQGGRDGYPDMFGADIKRLRGTVVDWFVSQDGETGGYVVQDDSIIDPNDYPDKIVGDKRVPGMTCWTDPEIMEYGDSSVCDFYGTVSAMGDGQVVMNIFGIAPIMANDIEFDEEDTSSTDEAEETTI